MAIVKTEYTGALSTSTTYALSDNPILTKAKPFGPTDLLTASSGSCIVTYIDFIAQKNNFEIPGTIVEIKKSMNADGTKVIAFDIDLNFKTTYSNDQKAVIEDAAKNCPVGNSLHPDVKRTYNFNY